MDPLTVSLGITVQSAPVVASDMPSWERIFIYAMAASGVAILALGAFALNRYKAAKENAKTIEALKEGNTNLEKKGDTKSITKAIARDDTAKLAIVESNIPGVQNLLDGIKQRLNDVIAEVAKNQAKITELRNYWDVHRRDNLTDPVTDPNLKDEYPEIEDVMNGLKNLQKANEARIKELSTAAESFNKVTTNNKSNQDKIDNANSSKLNDQKFTGE
jgi:hypothetical protein